MAEETKEIQVQTWSELNDVLYEGSWHEPLRRFRPTFAYRGVPDRAFTLQPSLARLGEVAGELETHMLRSFRKYARSQAVPSDSTWHWLALAQHHGLPTRMLDWTYSPYVALHFVTERMHCYERDGVVWRVDYARTNQALPARLRTILEEEGPAVQVFTAEMLERAARSLEQFDALADDPFMLFFEPPSLDERIINQYALFSLVARMRDDLADWLGRQEGALTRIVIPAALKWEIRDKLDQANITERVLYPGLDGLSQWLKRYYTPRIE